MMKRIGELNAEVTNLKADADRFKAEVERLTKAGDAMLLALNKPNDIFDNTDKNKSTANWHAAKEGKQP